MAHRAISLFDTILGTLSRAAGATTMPWRMPAAAEWPRPESGYPAYMLWEIMNRACLHHDLRFPDRNHDLGDVGTGVFWHDWTADRIFDGRGDRPAPKAAAESSWLEYPLADGNKVGVLALRSFYRPEVVTLIAFIESPAGMIVHSARFEPARVLSLLRQIHIGRRQRGLTMHYADMVDVVLLSSHMAPENLVLGPARARFGGIILDWLLITGLRDLVTVSVRTRIPGDGRPDHPLYFNRDAALADRAALARRSCR